MLSGTAPVERKEEGVWVSLYESVELHGFKIC